MESGQPYTRTADDCGPDGQSKESAAEEAHRQASETLHRVIAQEVEKMFGPDAVKACIPNGGK